MQYLDAGGGKMKRMTSKLKLANAPETPWQRIEFHSCLNKARDVEDQLIKACESCHYSEQDVFAIKLALEEALVNAVKHGNELNPCKCVKVSYRVTPQRADFTIEDQGKGFSPAELPDPTAEENLEMSHGRGILLMRAYMNSVVFSPKGNKVTLTKLNESYRPGQAALG